MSTQEQRERAMVRFVAHYEMAALWSSTDGNGEYLDESNRELSDCAQAAMLIECREFVELLQRAAGVDVFTLPAESGPCSIAGVAHDFWLTRNGHGAGFWDRAEWDQEKRDQLTALAQAAGERDLYIGDDGYIYQSGSEA